MRISSYLLTAATLAVAGCGEDGVTWRIPCGGTGQFTDEPAVSETYRFEGDAAGHFTLEEQTRGAVITLTTRRYEGDVVVEESFDDGTNQYQETATVEGGQRAVVTRTGNRSVDRYVETWRWRDGEPVGWVRDYENEQDREGVFGTGAGEALIENVCDRDAGGALTGCNSLRYSGPYARWTMQERDDNSDGMIEGVELRSFDDHDLETSWQRRFGGPDGRETLFLEVVTDRQRDGSPIQRRSTTQQPGFERAHTLIYSYTCD